MHHIKSFIEIVTLGYFPEPLPAKAPMSNQKTLKRSSHSQGELNNVRLTWTNEWFKKYWITLTNHTVRFIVMVPKWVSVEGLYQPTFPCPTRRHWRAARVSKIIARSHGISERMICRIIPGTKLHDGDYGFSSRTSLPTEASIYNQRTLKRKCRTQG